MAIKFGRPLERSRLAPVEAEAPAQRLDLAIRPRRNRRAEWSRRLVRDEVVEVVLRLLEEPRAPHRAEIDSRLLTHTADL